MDAAMIHYNAARAAYGLSTEAGNYDAQAAADRMAASNAKSSGISKAAMSLISGATAVSAKYSAYKQLFPTGALGGSSGGTADSSLTNLAVKYKGAGIVPGSSMAGY